MNEIEIPVNILLLVSRWFHIAAVIMAIGGAAFTRLAFIPGVRDSLNGDTADKVRTAVAKRWTMVVHASIGLLLLTGFFNFYTLAIRTGIEPMPYHAIFGLKLISALGVFFIAEALVGRSVAFEGMRRRNALWLSVLLCLAAVIILLSGLLNQVRAASASSPLPI